MPDYKAMYYSLFNAMTDAIEILKAGQQKGERLFVEDESGVPAENNILKMFSQENGNGPLSHFVATLPAGESNVQGGGAPDGVS